MSTFKKYNVIIFNGPPHVGKSQYYWCHLSDTHEHVCPEKEFNQDPQLSLHQLIFNVITLLQKGKKVVIDDENWSTAKRNSYLSLITKKVPECKFLCIRFQPVHGYLQLWWSREFQAARDAELSPGKDAAFKMTVSDLKIDKWCKEDSFLEYNALESPDVPIIKEGFSEIQEVYTQLTVQISYKFEIPGLFIQWDGIVNVQADEVTLHEGVGKAISEWYSCNPCSRIIIVADGCLPPGVTSLERNHHIRTLLQDLIQSLDETVVYLLCVEEASNSGLFSEPPLPGLLAYLQRLQHIDLQHHATMYWYESQKHMRMAEKAGVKHIKASRVFAHTNLARSTHCTINSSCPQVLQDMKVIAPFTSEQSMPPVVPLYEQSLQATETVCWQNLGHGRVLYLASKNKQVIKRHHDLYMEYAATIEQNISRIATMSEQVSQPDIPKPTSKIMNVSRSHRGLPTWMVSKNGKKQIKRKDELLTSLHSPTVKGAKSRRKGLVSGSRKPDLPSAVLTTTYVMTEQELLQEAKNVLIQAGRQLPTEEMVAMAINQRQVAVTQHPAQQQIDTNSNSTAAGQSRLADAPAGHISSHEIITPLARHHRVTAGHDVSDDDSEQHTILDDILDSDEDSSPTRKLPPKRTRVQMERGTLGTDPVHKLKTPSTEKRKQLLSESDTENFHTFLKPSVSVDDILVLNTSSEMSSKSSRPSFCIMDSHVSNTSSSKTVSPKPSISIGNSFVSNTESSKSLSNRPDITVSNSFVGNTSSDITTPSPMLTNTTPVRDSFVKNTSSSDLHQSINKPCITVSETESGSESDNPRDDDMHKVYPSASHASVASGQVQETVAPTTAVPKLTERKSARGQRKPEEKKTQYGPDLSVLEGIL